MGRSRIPLTEQAAHLTKSEIAERQYAESKTAAGQEELYDVAEDTFVNAAAYTEYMRILENIKKMELVGNFEKAHLIGYANAYGYLETATKALKKGGLFINSEGIEIPNPIIKTQLQYGEEMRKYAKLCGLTIDSRLKAAAHKTIEEKEEVAEEFGDI